MTGRLAAALAGAALLLPLPAAWAGQACAPETVAVAGSEPPVAFTVEVADEDAERAQGLMFRREMAPDRGMIFLYPDEAPRFFWMKNTYLPLDIVFFDAGGRVVHVAENTTPFSERTISSRAPAMGALEINAGLAAAHGIGPGTVLVHPAFADAAPEEWRCE